MPAQDNPHEFSTLPRVSRPVVVQAAATPEQAGPAAISAGEADQNRRLSAACVEAREMPAATLSALRCNEKACVFPAKPGTLGKCLYHQRQLHEPAMFHSLQPSRLLLEHAKFGLPECEPTDTRAADRRRLATQRQAFLWEEAA